MQEVELHPRPGRARCPFCLDALEDGEVTTTCRRCGATAHSDCLRELGGVCPTRGCGKVLGERLPPFPEWARLGGAEPTEPRRALDAGPRAGDRRACTRCDTQFVVEAASPYNPYCASCRRRRSETQSAALVILVLQAAILQCMALIQLLLWIWHP